MTSWADVLVPPAGRTPVCPSRRGAHQVRHSQLGQVLGYRRARACRPVPARSLTDISRSARDQKKLHAGWCRRASENTSTTRSACFVGKPARGTPLLICIHTQIVARFLSPPAGLRARTPRRIGPASSPTAPTSTTIRDHPVGPVPWSPGTWAAREAEHRDQPRKPTAHISVSTRLVCRNAGFSQSCSGRWTTRAYCSVKRGERQRPQRHQGAEHAAGQARGVGVHPVPVGGTDDHRHGRPRRRRTRWSRSPGSAGRRSPSTLRG